MTGLNPKLTRIAVFYDGGFFSHVSDYYCYHHAREDRLSFTGLHEFICQRVADKEEVSRNHCTITEAHYFRGRRSLKAMHGEDREDQLAGDRIFDEVLMREGVATHYLPLTPHGEKGVDVWLSLEAYERALRRDFDVCVLVAGDGDFVPLVRKLQILGTRVMVLAWGFAYNKETGQEHQTKTSGQLLQAAIYGLQMDQIIGPEEEHADRLINGLFVPDTRDEPELWDEQGGEAVSEDFVPAGAQIPGRIEALKDGYGFIKPDRGGENIFFYYTNLLNKDFNDLQTGDRVEYREDTNERGPCAVAIQVLD